MKIALAKDIKNQKSKPTKREAKHERDATQKHVKELTKGNVRPKKSDAKARLEMIRQKVLKEHPNANIWLASEMRQEILKIPFGIVGLDIALLGGVAQSRIAEIAGKFSVGKTTSAYKSHAYFQRELYPEDGAVLNVNTEKEADTTYMAANGMDLDRTLIIMPDYGDEAGDQAGDVMMEMYESPLKLYTSIDSIATMIPKVKNESLSKSKMGKQPALITEFVKKLLTCMKSDALSPEPKNTVLLLNQVRTDIGVLFGDPTIIPGGEGKKNWCSQIILLKQAGKIGEKIAIGKGKDKYDFFEVHLSKGRYQILKNKCHGAPFATGEFHLHLRASKGYSTGEFDNADQLYNLSLAFRTIELKTAKKGTTEVIFPDGTVLSSAKAAIERLKADKEFYYMTYEALLKKRYDDFWDRGNRETYGELVEEDDPEEDERFFGDVE